MKPKRHTKTLGTSSPERYSRRLGEASTVGLDDAASQDTSYASLVEITLHVCSQVD